MEAKSNMDTLMQELEVKLNNSNEKRNKVIDLLMANVSTLVPSGSENDGPKMVEAKASVLSMLDSMLKNSETNAINKVKMLLLRKETESTVNLREAAVSMLRVINPKAAELAAAGGIANAMEVDDDELESKLAEKNVPGIPDSELEIHDN